MSNVMPIRRAAAADGPACAAILDTWIEATPWMTRGVSRDALEQLLTAGLPKREAWVIGAPVAGYLSLDPAESHIWGFYVGQTSEGLGKLLMDRAKEGRTRLQLNTHLPNTRAHAFYAREGFAQGGGAWDGDDGIPEIRMEWQAEGGAC